LGLKDLFGIYGIFLGLLDKCARFFQVIYPSQVVTFLEFDITQATISRAV